MIQRQKAGLVLGPVLFLLILLSEIEGLSWQAKAVAANTAWIACWWLTEAIPIPATSLLPIILFPLLGALEVEIAFPSQTKTPELIPGNSQKRG